MKLNFLKLQNKAKITPCHQSTTFKSGQTYVAMCQPLNGQSKMVKVWWKLVNVGQIKGVKMQLLIYWDLLTNLDCNSVGVGLEFWQDLVIGNYLDIFR